MKPEKFISVENISVRLYDKFYLQDLSWQINTNEHWAILGPNGAGKSTLVRALFNDVPIVKGRIVYHFAKHQPRSFEENYRSIGYVSSELHRDIIARENLQDTFRHFSGKVDEFTTVRSLLTNGRPLDGDERGYVKLNDISRRTGIEGLLEHAIKNLSMGDMRKVLIARALMKSPKLLILDEPFDGLDLGTRDALLELINELMQGRMRVVLITHRFEEILPEITHVMFLKNGRLHSLGEKKAVLTEKAIQAVYGKQAHLVKSGILEDLKAAVPPPEKPRPQTGATRTAAPANLIEMKDVIVKYGRTVALDHFSWRMNQGENWAILGPNGAGKTTILKLITGENLQAYANEIYLFGRRKGSGESVWEIKKNLGVISSDLQLQYPPKISAFDVVCSGFFDSIGLYRYCSTEQIEIAKEWIRAFNIQPLAGQNFGRLSGGQRQLILIARAMVKSPVLLMLDEPCEGLDVSNKAKVLAVADFIGEKTETNVIFVTNHAEEILPCTTHKLELAGGKIKAAGKIEPGAF